MSEDHPNEDAPGFWSEVFAWAVGGVLMLGLVAICLAVVLLAYALSEMAK